jgi:phosphoglycolate phosphatase
MVDFLLLFDLDGTLVNNLPDLASALNDILKERGYAPLFEQEVRSMLGDGIAGVLVRGFAARGLGRAEAMETLPRFISIYEANAMSLSRPYPEVRETLAALRSRGYTIGLCTNKPQRATLEVLRGFKLEELFDGVAGGDRFGAKKPNPGHLLGLIRELGARVEHTAMIGDSENDAAAAHAAALPLFLMRYGYAQKDPGTLGAVRVLDRFDELPEALEALSLVP